MRFLVGITSAFGAGTLVGVGIGILMTENKCRKEYQESTAAFQRAMELARNNPVPEEEPAEESKEDFMESGRKLASEREDLIIQGVDPADLPIPSAPPGPFKPADNNPYHIAVEDPEASFVYLTVDDYEDDDDRFKGQITILMDGDNPVFLEEGSQINNWEEKIGTHILRDLYTMIPPGQPAVLYVRNTATDEDYEVIRDQP